MMIDLAVPMIVFLDICKWFVGKCAIGWLPESRFLLAPAVAQFQRPPPTSCGEAFSFVSQLQGVRTLVCGRSRLLRTSGHHVIA